MISSSQGTSVHSPQSHQTTKTHVNSSAVAKDKPLSNDYYHVACCTLSSCIGHLCIVLSMVFNTPEYTTYIQSCDQKQKSTLNKEIKPEIIVRFPNWCQPEQLLHH